MNNYPSWWNTTITVYNKYENTSTREVTWYKHSITNCFWKYASDKVIINNTTLETDRTICRIPKDTNFAEDYVWKALTAEQKATKFTLQPGDIIIRGEVTDTIDEYTSGQRSSDLISKYKKLQGCMIIDYTLINVDGGRCQEHYHVKGK